MYMISTENGLIFVGTATEAREFFDDMYEMYLDSTPKNERETKKIELIFSAKGSIGATDFYENEVFLIEKMEACETLENTVLLLKSK